MSWLLVLFCRPLLFLTGPVLMSASEGASATSSVTEPKSAENVDLGFIFI